MPSLPPEPVPGPRRPFLTPVTILLTGVILVAFAAHHDAEIAENTPWREAMLFPDTPTPGSGDTNAIPVSVRRLDEGYLQESAEMLAELRKNDWGNEVIDTLKLDKAENVVLMDLPRERLQEILGAGRLPEPGQPEALAGELARGNEFPLDDEIFRVVGRLRRGVGGLAFAYVIPDTEEMGKHFTTESGATTGHIEITPAADVEEEAEAERSEAPQKVIGGLNLADNMVSLLTLLGLMFVATGGSLAQFRFLRLLSARWSDVFAASLSEILAYPRLFASIHILLYSLFFVGMFVAKTNPVFSLRMAEYVRQQFGEGDLSYIGAAYASGDIIRATLATFYHNYLVATVSLTLLPSIVIPFAGLFKNAVTFGAVGFVMSPIWEGSAAPLVYHSITMTLEMEAYIVASFAVTLMPILWFRGLRNKNGVLGYLNGFRAISHGTLISGLMLAIAAAYEAITLILLNR